MCEDPPHLFFIVLTDVEHVPLLTGLDLGTTAVVAGDVDHRGGPEVEAGQQRHVLRVGEDDDAVGVADARRELDPPRRVSLMPIQY